MVMCIHVTLTLQLFFNNKKKQGFAGLYVGTIYELSYVGIWLKLPSTKALRLP